MLGQMLTGHMRQMPFQKQEAAQELILLLTHL